MSISILGTSKPLQMLNVVVVVILIYIFLVKPEEAFADYKNKKGESVFQPEKKSDDELLAELGIFYCLGIVLFKLLMNC